MGEFNIILVYHGVLECCIHALVAKQVLYLLNWHTFINRHCCQCATKLVWVYFGDIQLFADLP